MMIAWVDYNKIQEHPSIYIYNIKPASYDPTAQFF